MIQQFMKYSLIGAIAWTVIIFGLCCMPGKYIPTTHWLELLSVDKLVHAGIFFVLAAWWLLYLAHSVKSHATLGKLVLLSCIAYGGLLEMMQATVFSQRSADWFDFIANALGCIMAYWLFNKYKSHILSLHH